MTGIEKLVFQRDHVRMVFRGRLHSWVKKGTRELQKGDERAFEIKTESRKGRLGTGNQEEKVQLLQSRSVVVTWKIREKPHGGRMGIWAASASVLKQK